MCLPVLPFKLLLGPDMALPRTPTYSANHNHKDSIVQSSEFDRSEERKGFLVIGLVVTGCTTILTIGGVSLILAEPRNCGVEPPPMPNSRISWNRTVEVGAVVEAGTRAVYSCMPGRALFTRHGKAVAGGRHLRTCTGKGSWDNHVRGLECRACTNCR